MIEQIERNKEGQGEVCFLAIFCLNLNSSCDLFLNLVICHFEKSLEFPWVLIYKNKLLLNTIKRDLQKACLFSNIFHFINSLCDINNHLVLYKNFKDIYPSQPELKKESI